MTMQRYETKMLSDSDEDIALAAQLLKSGEVVGIPTETVYGLAADAENESAVKKIFEAKGRPSDNPLIVHISDISMLDRLVSEVSPVALKCAERFWPGPLTMVMPKSDNIPYVTSGGLDTVGVRFPSHKTAQKIISACGKALAAPSANLSGSPSPTLAKHVLDDMNGRISAIVDGGSCTVGVESTVVSFESGAIRVLRPGMVSVDMLKEVCENVIVDKGVLSQLDISAKVRSPGMKYKHYSPKAQVYIIKGSTRAVVAYLEEHIHTQKDIAVDYCGELAGDHVRVLPYGSTAKEQAQNLFAVLRKCDDVGAERVFVRCPDKSGEGLAVYNRLLRAAAFRIIEV